MRAGSDLLQPPSAPIFQLCFATGGAYTSVHMTDIVKAYLDARTKLHHEKTAMESRLREINKVLEQSALNTARSAPVRRGRPPTVKANADGKPRKRKMSAAGRAAISAATKARWAKAKAAGKKRL